MKLHTFIKRGSTKNALLFQSVTLSPKKVFFFWFFFGIIVYRLTNKKARREESPRIFLYVFISAFFVIKFFSLIFGFASEPYSKSREDVHINVGKNNRRMHFEVAEFRQLAERKPCVVRGNRANRECDKQFVDMQSRVSVAEVDCFKILHGLDYMRRINALFIMQKSAYRSIIKDFYIKKG